MLICNAPLAFRAMPSGAERPYVISEEVGRSSGLITLNRPKALNALNLDMIRQMYGTMKRWQDVKKHLVIVKGAGGKSFCSGGDIRVLAEDGPVELSKTQIRELYRLVELTGSYKPDYVAIMDGITMGGGAGLSVHGKYRVATERTVFAMPETAVGLFPDVGSGYFLPRLQGKLGLYLGMTGYRLKGKDVVKDGIATHYVESVNLEALEMELFATSNSSQVAKVLDKFNVNDSSEFVLAKNMKQINECFSGPTVESICVNLEKDGSEWAQSTLKTLNKMSPLSLKITKKHLDHERYPDLRSCLKMEFRMFVQFVRDGNFKEGVRAKLIDSDQNPKWNPSKISDVTDQLVDQFIGPILDTDKLIFEDELKSKL